MPPNVRKKVPELNAIKTTRYFQITGATLVFFYIVATREEKNAILCGLLRCQSLKRFHEVLVTAAETNKYTDKQKQNKKRKNSAIRPLKRGLFFLSSIRLSNWNHITLCSVTRSDNQPIKFYIMTIHANLE
ncbi:hypothetical protein chiPu_0012428 [Chiloscyllium punctatum]|uniref:Uncharacterized protein n=1 Tax=Chiloscyllium punctatum TaxID=137246 RepID=A0A401SU66_CHIPU|nr:hypothetical protein [Chiloscyllium punctatum]